MNLIFGNVSSSISRAKPAVFNVEPPVLLPSPSKLKEKDVNIVNRKISDETMV